MKKHIMWTNRRVKVIRSCFFINEDPGEQALFLEALGDMLPQTLCFTAPDGIDGLSMMQREGLIPDFIFIEMIIPRMDALGFLQQIKKINTLRDIPVVVHAVSPTPHQIVAVKEAGAAAVYLREYSYGGICRMLSIYMTDMIMTDIVPVIHLN